MEEFNNNIYNRILKIKYWSVIPHGKIRLCVDVVRVVETRVLVVVDDGRDEGGQDVELRDVLREPALRDEVVEGLEHIRGVC